MQSTPRLPPQVLEVICQHVVNGNISACKLRPLRRVCRDWHAAASSIIKGAAARCNNPRLSTQASSGHRDAVLPVPSALRNLRALDLYGGSTTTEQEQQQAAQALLARQQGPITSEPQHQQYQHQQQREQHEQHEQQQLTYLRFGVGGLDDDGYDVSLYPPLEAVLPGAVQVQALSLAEAPSHCPKLAACLRCLPALRSLDVDLHFYGASRARPALPLASQAAGQGEGKAGEKAGDNKSPPASDAADEAGAEPEDDAEGAVYNGEQLVPNKFPPLWAALTQLTSLSLKVSILTDDQPVLGVRRLTQLRELELTDGECCDEHTWDMRWLTRLTHLTRLVVELQGLTVLPRDLRPLAALQHLQLRGFLEAVNEEHNRVSFRPSSLWALTQLTALVLSDFTRQEEESAVVIEGGISALTALRTCQVSPCITRRALAELCTLTSLRCLRVVIDDTGLEGEEVPGVAPNAYWAGPAAGLFTRLFMLTQLTQLDVNPVNAQGFISFWHLPASLEALCEEEPQNLCEWPDDAAEELEHLTALRKLVLLKPETLSNLLAGPLAARLTCLVVKHCSLLPVDNPALAQLPSLQALTLRCGYRSGKERPVSRLCLQCLSQLTGLTCLELVEPVSHQSTGERKLCSSREAAPAWLPHLTRLTRLRLLGLKLMPLQVVKGVRPPQGLEGVLRSLELAVLPQHWQRALQRSAVAAALLEGVDVEWWR